jgi:hypothetical protein
LPESRLTAEIVSRQGHVNIAQEQDAGHKKRPVSGQPQRLPGVFSRTGGPFGENLAIA